MLCVVFLLSQRRVGGREVVPSESYLCRDTHNTGHWQCGLCWHAQWSTFTCVQHQLCCTVTPHVLSWEPHLTPKNSFFWRKTTPTYVSNEREESDGTPQNMLDMIGNLHDSRHTRCYAWPTVSLVAIYISSLYLVPVCIPRTWECWLFFSCSQWIVELY